MLKNISERSAVRRAPFIGFAGSAAFTIAVSIISVIVGIHYQRNVEEKDLQKALLSQWKLFNDSANELHAQRDRMNLRSREDIQAVVSRYDLVVLNLTVLEDLMKKSSDKDSHWNNEVRGIMELKQKLEDNKQYLDTVATSLHQNRLPHCQPAEERTTLPVWGQSREETTFVQVVSARVC